VGYSAAAWSNITLTDMNGNTETVYFIIGVNSYCRLRILYLQTSYYNMSKYGCVLVVETSSHNISVFALISVDIFNYSTMSTKADMVKGVLLCFYTFSTLVCV